MAQYSQDDRARFEEDYRKWTRLMAIDAACRLSALPPTQQDVLQAAYQNFKDPGQVFRDISSEERIGRLAGERFTAFIFVETDAIAFFPSVASPYPGAIDYSVAMNRRLYFGKRWYPIVSFNSEYIRQSSDHILAFALQHEFEMSRIYQEMATPGRLITSDEKREIMLSAQETSQEKLTITVEELKEDDRLMQHLARSSPLLPKPYAEMALLHYLQSNLSRLESYGIKSSGPEEEAFGEELAEEFAGWAQFTTETYDLFLREMAARLRDANQGYA